MATRTQLIALRTAIATDARLAFDELTQRIGDENLYGFAIYTEDSALGLDAAANSVVALQRKLALPRTNPFEAYWFTTEWEHEGGVASWFDPSCDIIETLAPDANDESAYDEFRRGVFKCMVDAMDVLRQEGYFAKFGPPEKMALQIAIADSDDDEQFMNAALLALNPPCVYQKYLREKDSAGC